MGRNHDDKQLIKEGFLVKKGHVRTNWRTRWFELYEDKLLYYRKKGDKVAAGVVPLKGCSVISPCPMYQKKKGVFQVTDSQSNELLMQASANPERDEWAQMIGDAIKACERLEQKGEHAGIDLNELVVAMQDPNGGIKLDDYTVAEVLHRNCFTGEEVVDWLITWSFAANRKEAASLGESLVAEAHIRNLSKQSSSGDSQGPIFVDEEKALYKYSAFHMGDLKSAFDSDESGSDSEFSSDDQEGHSKKEKRPTPKPAPRPTVGRIVKQGFLIKRGHVRHTWKARLFVLWDNPPLLQYYKGSKVQGEKPLGEIDIKWCTINTLEQSNADIAIKNKQRKNLFSVRTEKGKIFVLQAATPEEQHEWMVAIMSPMEVQRLASAATPGPSK